MIRGVRDAAVRLASLVPDWAVYSAFLGLIFASEIPIIVSLKAIFRGVAAARLGAMPVLFDTAGTVDAWVLALVAVNVAVWCWVVATTGSDEDGYRKGLGE